MQLESPLTPSIRQGTSWSSWKRKTSPLWVHWTSKTSRREPLLHHADPTCATRDLHGGFYRCRNCLFFVRFARNKINPNHFFSDSRWPTLGFRIKITTIPVEPRTYEIVGSERKPGVLHQNPGFWKAMFFIMFEFPWSVMIFPVLWSFCLKSCLNVWKSLRNSKSCHMMRCTLAKCSTLFLHPRKYPIRVDTCFGAILTTSNYSPFQSNKAANLNHRQTYRKHGAWRWFINFPRYACKFEGCIHFSI